MNDVHGDKLNDASKSNNQSTGFQVTVGLPACHSSKQIIVTVLIKYETKNAHEFQLRIGKFIDSSDSVTLLSSCEVSKESKIENIGKYQCLG